VARAGCCSATAGPVTMPQVLVSHRHTHQLGLVGGVDGIGEGVVVTIAARPTEGAIRAQRAGRIGQREALTDSTGGCNTGLSE
jgi:hypothetical protein